MWDKILQDYFTFTKRERIAVITLVLLIVIFLLLPRMIPDTPMEVDHITLGEVKLQPAKQGANDEASSRHLNTSPEYSKNSDDAAPVTAAGKLFYFDPNTLPEAGWKQLGLPDKTIHTLKNYLAKGGVFRKAADIEKIYGLRREQLNRLLPFVRIAAPAATMQSERTRWQPVHMHSVTTYAAPARMFAPVDINMADTSAFISLPGIGSKLAARIIHFRDKLGGFYSINQVSEIYGLADSVFAIIKPHLIITNTGVRMVNLNTVEAAELKEHPYFRWAIANAIIAYRRQHGNFTNVESLMQIALISPELFKKMAPYISLE